MTIPFSFELRDTLRAHLAATGASKAELARACGLNEGAVAKILRNPSYVPPARVMEALEAGLGVPLPSPFQRKTRTWRQISDELAAADPHDRRLSRIRWLMRNAGWTAGRKVADRQEVIDFFSRHRPATFDLAPSTWATYKSDLLGTLPAPLARTPGIRDVTGWARDTYDRIGKCRDLRDYHLVSGAFLAWMHAEGLQPSDLTEKDMLRYHDQRLASGTKTERAVKHHVQKCAALTRRIAVHPDFTDLGFPALPSPWSRPAILPGEAEIAPLMEEFDTRVAPWLLGERSASGETRATFLARLDAASPAKTGAAAGPRDLQSVLSRLRGESGTKGVHQRPMDEDEAAAAGFLTRNRTWAASTVASYRKSLAAFARRLAIEEGIVCPSLREATEPDVVEAMVLLTLRDNPDAEGFGSAYPSTFLGRTVKVARDYARQDEKAVEKLKELASGYAPKRSGIAPRNRAKLEEFSTTRTTRFRGLATDILRDVKLEIAARRRKAHKRGEHPATVDLYDRALACQVMQAIAHDLLLARAPRSENVLAARLDQVRWRESRATLVVPAVEVKGREAGDPDLVIPLGEEQSATLRAYLDHVRPKALRPGDAANPYLFPSPKKPGAHYGALLNALCKQVHARTGAELHPHLYRHLVGWIWLKEDPDALPHVQRLLGHRSIATTMRYYAEIADQVAIDAWQKFISKEKANDPDPTAGPGVARPVPPAHASQNHAPHRDPGAIRVGGQRGAQGRTKPAARA
ncbi:tyrosine-type recombinase/integrase [Tranquillimonas alkanivorans]|uniref:Phage integrase family protein n=1 Tax=Tranquillimonas alkanivorans TaxID=441119 RepID=A0A1I5VY44_9RHOB|nr:tyrosine-type recombinase/integrase [Tranquillimonas alkanivorans]SFQ12350.1 Phage integrase family protein [Tranquillimonas alkanivorans]